MPPIVEGYADAANRVRAVWDGLAGQWAGGGTHWMEHPAVQARLRGMTGGPGGRDRFQYLLHRYFPEGASVDRVLSLGCGAGDFERGFAQYGFARAHDALDIAEGAIATARALAIAQGFDHIHYEAVDLNHARLPRRRYDVVFGLSTVHHIANLEHLFAEVQASLVPGGYFLLDEFVGPSQFQWPDAQLALANAALAMLPDHLRRSVGRPGESKAPVSRPTLEAMKAGDPSESIRSAEILGLLPDYFDVLEVRGAGGSLLHLVLEDIAGNFAPDVPAAAEWLETLFAMEDALIGDGRLAHDFAVIIARARH
jgi:SAM-dependent methyltransferase